MLLALDPVNEIRRVRDSRDGHCAAIDPGLDTDARKRRIPSVACTHNARALCIDNPLRRKITEPVGEVRLHLATPFPISRLYPLLVDRGTAIIRLQDRISLGSHGLG